MNNNKIFGTTISSPILVVYQFVYSAL